MVLESINIDKIRLMNHMIYLFIESYFSDVAPTGEIVHGLSKYTLQVIPKCFIMYTYTMLIDD